MQKSPITFEVKEKRKNLSLGLTIDQLSYVVESLLSYWSFVENGGKLMKNPDNLKTASQQLELLRSVILRGVDHDLGTNGWKFQKWIEVCHLLTETPVYGPTRARDTNSGERHLKIWAVRPSKTFQKKG